MDRHDLFDRPTPPLIRIPPELADTFPFRVPALPQRQQSGKNSGPRSLKISKLTIEAGLESHAGTLDMHQAGHLLRRAGFGGSPSEIAGLVGEEVDTAVDALVDAAMSKPLPEPPSWVDEGLPRDREERAVYLDETNPVWLTEYYVELMRQVYEGGLRERMTLFWHNHFVTSIRSYFIAPYAYRYITTLQTHALGNFKDFVHAIGIDPAMLLYLNGTQNLVGQPNENYARELLELFTMGQLDSQGDKNYDQADIEEIARALTGWQIDPFSLSVQLVFINHDFGEKTIFGRTGEWGYDDVVDILFEERASQIAEFICRKLYREFVYAEPDEAVVSGLAQVFLDQGFEIAPVMRVLLKSAHFHDEQIIGAQIKSPISMVTDIWKTAGFVPHEPQLMLMFRAADVLDQRLLDPPNVAGWEGHHAWLNTSTFPFRWLISDAQVFENRTAYGMISFRAAAETLLAQHDESIDPNHPASVFVLAAVMAEHFVPVPLETLDLSPPPDGFVGDLTNDPIPQEYLDGPPHVLELTQIFLQGTVPWYEWRLDHAQAGSILQLYVRYLAQLPEFQLT